MQRRESAVTVKRDSGVTSDHIQPPRQGSRPAISLSFTRPASSATWALMHKIPAHCLLQHADRGFL